MFYSCLRESIFIYLRVCTFLFLYPSRLFLLWRLLGCSFFAVCCFGVCSCVSSCVLLVSVCKLTSREFHVNSRGGPRWSRCCYGAVLLSLIWALCASGLRAYVRAKLLQVMCDSVTLWTVAHQAPPPLLALKVEGGLQVKAGGWFPKTWGKKTDKKGSSLEALG